MGSVICRRVRFGSIQQRGYRPKTDIGSSYQGKGYRVQLNVKNLQVHLVHSGFESVTRVPSCCEQYLISSHSIKKRPRGRFFIYISHFSLNRITLESPRIRMQSENIPQIHPARVSALQSRFLLRQPCVPIAQRVSGPWLPQSIRLPVLLNVVYRH